MKQAKIEAVYNLIRPCKGRGESEPFLVTQSMLGNGVTNEAGSNFSVDITASSPSFIASVFCSFYYLKVRLSCSCSDKDSEVLLGFYQNTQFILKVSQRSADIISLGFSTGHDL